MKSYTTTVGIEVHAELKTKSKMFCGCSNDPHAAEPNAHVCPICMAHPGTLPTVNKEAVTLLMQVGTAIGGTLADYSEFDRKNYFYPDIPKAYQISQYQFPFVVGGTVAGVAITRIHLEEDTARSQHNDAKGVSYVDFNRAGVPLMELVTEPVIHDAETAGKFAKELQLLLRSLGASDANMERGEMRVEANISVSTSDTLGTKVEVKNLNSFRAVESAIAYETKRQIEVLESGGTVVQETRGWDENRSKTFSQRVKESADDYRYFPDPDIPKFKRSEIPEFDNTRLHEIVKKTPDFKRNMYKDLGVPSDKIEVIIADTEREKFFNQAVVGANEKLAGLLANYLTSDLVGVCEDGSHAITDANPTRFRALMELVRSGEVTSRVAKDLMIEVVFMGAEPRELAEKRGLLQQNSADALAPIIAQILIDNPAVVDEYRAGKEAVLQFLVGQGMKATKGSANPSLLADLIKQATANQ